jgi:hypothetical protein
MPGSKSNYLENKLLDHVYGGPDYPRPATVYVALFTAAPTDSGGGTEVSGSGVSRGLLRCAGLHRARARRAWTSPN